MTDCAESFISMKPLAQTGLTLPAAPTTRTITCQEDINTNMCVQEQCIYIKAFVAHRLSFTRQHMQASFEQK